MTKQDERTAKSALDDALGSCRWAFLALFVFSLAINLLSLVSPIYMMQVFDRVLSSRSMDTLLLLTLMVTGALGVMTGLEIVRSRLMVRISNWLDTRLGGELLTGDIALALRNGNVRSAQGLRDLATFRNFLTGPSVFPILDAPWVPLFLAVIFMLHPMLGWIATLGAIALFALALIGEILTRQSTQLAGLAAREAQQQADLFVRNANVVDAMGMMPNLVQRWQVANETAFILQGSASDQMGIVAAVSRFVRLLLQTLILAAGAYLTIEHEASGGAIMGASLIMGKALSPIEQAITSWKSLLVARAAYARLRAILATAPVRGERTQLPAPIGTVSLEGVIFGQPGHKEPVIKGVSFELPAGQTLAVIGASAAGKSTLAQLIVGNWRPFRGQVRLDGADITNWDADELGRHVGYLPQDVELFDGTVRDNIARLGEGSDEDVIEAAQKACVHDMILRMPEGYDTPIGNGGSALSGGQRQRIALARALYGNPRLVVLDEPDASLDSGAENRLIETLQGLKGKATVILITHRLTLLNLADRVLMMRGGLVEAYGTRDEVVARLTGVVATGPQPAANVTRINAGAPRTAAPMPVPQGSR